MDKVRMKIVKNEKNQTFLNTPYEWWVFEEIGVMK